MLDQGGVVHGMVVVFVVVTASSHYHWVRPPGCVSFLVRTSSHIQAADAEPEQ